jgi:GH35 family endo-1,4-beta-xylanase
LFGPVAKYEKADKMLDFMKSGQQIQGHTLELIAQQGGNLRKVRMKADDF